MLNFILIVVAIAASRWAFQLFGSSPLATELYRAGRKKNLDEQIIRELVKSARFQLDQEYRDVFHKALLKENHRAAAHERALRSTGRMALLFRGNSSKKVELEIEPFLLANDDAGRRSLIEYVIWRYFPARANVEMIKDVIIPFKSKHPKKRDSVEHDAEFSWQKL